MFEDLAISFLRTLRFTRQACLFRNKEAVIV